MVERAPTFSPTETQNRRGKSCLAESRRTQLACSPPPAELLSLLDSVLSCGPSSSCVYLALGFLLAIGHICVYALIWSTSQIQELDSSFGSFLPCCVLEPPNSYLVLR
jgi:hypothetical protein